VTGRYPFKVLGEKRFDRFRFQWDALQTQTLFDLLYALVAGNTGRFSNVPGFPTFD
jgi:hypothetical protein